MNTAWTHDDVLVNLTEEVKAVKEFYNVPTLEHVPDSEITLIAFAQLGDLVHVGKGRVGIVYDVIEYAGSQAIACVMTNGRTITRTRAL